MTLPAWFRQRRKDLGRSSPHADNLAGLLGLGQKVPGHPGGSGIVQVENPQHIPQGDDHRGPQVQIHSFHPPFCDKIKKVPLSYHSPPRERRTFLYNTGENFS